MDEILERSKQKKNQTAMEGLPEDVLSSILSRLSVKELLRCKATCTRWNSLISNRDFGLEHAAARRDKFDSGIIIMDLLLRGLYMVGCDSLLNGRRLNKFSWNGKSYDSSGYTVVGCCNGLVCLLISNSTKVLVWNPATREIWKVRDVVPLTNLMLGFGYDHWSHDYKILTMQEPGVGRLFSLKTNLVKPIILQDHLPWEEASDLLKRCALYLKGCLHWSLLNSDISLVSFDLKDDVFVRTPLFPKGLSTMVPDWLGLGIVEDCLCVYVYLPCRSCEVWIMKEYGVRSSWRRLFRSYHLTLYLTPFVGMPDGKVLFSGQGSYFIVLDPREGKMSRGMDYSEQFLSRPSIVGFPCVTWAYKESVISPRALFSVEDTSRTKQLSGIPKLSRLKRTSEVKIMLGSHILYAIDCDSLLNSQPSAHRFLWMGKSFECHRVVGSCNGLVLLQDKFKKERLWLWNPTTREVREIRDMDRCRDYSFIAFGYDPLSDDYKIVIIHPTYSCERIAADMRCLKSDTWKTIPAPCLAGKMLGDPRGVHLNGVLHWSALNANGSIVSFDLHEEIFPQTLLLPETATVKTSSLEVGVIGDCLGICMPCVGRGREIYEVWMMKEYGVRSSWSILFRTDGPKRPLVPLAITRDGKIIIDCGNWYFRVYDPTKGKLSPAKTYTEKEKICLRWIYQETWVSPHTLQSH